jgi:7,8-dihydro-6-hydroxymethylpterin-pyrophosphokinase
MAVGQLGVGADDGARCRHSDAVRARRRDEYRRLRRSRLSKTGSRGIDFGVAFYGAPVVAFLVIVISFLTAKRRGGMVVPLCGWALLVADVIWMAVTVSG